MAQRRAARSGADTEARELVVAAIEQDAVTEAQAIVAATRYPPLIGGGAARDAFCAVHHDDA